MEPGQPTLVDRAQRPTGDSNLASTPRRASAAAAARTPASSAARCAAAASSTAALTAAIGSAATPLSRTSARWPRPTEVVKNFGGVGWAIVVKEGPKYLGEPGYGEQAEGAG